MAEGQFEALLRIEDVSEITGITPDTLRHWRHRGVGPKSSRLGRRIVYRRSDVNDWLELELERTAAGGKPAA